MYSFWLLSLTLAAAPEAQAVRLNEDVTSGQLVAIEDEAIRIETGSGQMESLPIQDLRALRFPEVEPPSPFADPPAVTLLLTDGTELAATDYRTTRDQVVAQVEDLGEIRLPLAAVRGVRLGDPDKVSARWAELLQRENRADLLVRRKEDVLDFVEGSLGDVGATELSFLLGERTVAVPRDRVFGIIYAVRPEQRVRQVGEVRAGRNRLQARTLTIADEQCRVTLAATPVVIPVPLARVHLIEFSGRVKFLGDLEPVVTLPEGRASDEQSDFFRRGTASNGSPLLIGRDEVYSQEGLWLHSGVTLRYRINRDFRRLAALVGLDHNVERPFPVRLVIVGDRRTLFDEVIHPDAPARPLDLDVSDVRDLEIRVERTPESLTQNFFGACEHLDLGQIRLLR